MVIMTETWPVRVEITNLEFRASPIKLAEMERWCWNSLPNGAWFRAAGRVWYFTNNEAATIFRLAWDT